MYNIAWHITWYSDITLHGTATLHYMHGILFFNEGMPNESRTSSEINSYTMHEETATPEGDTLFKIFKFVLWLVCVGKAYTLP